MMMLTGIKAFEACWQSLKAGNPTDLAENRLLMQSMGRLVDNYATQDEIAQELPAVLGELFDRLVEAYLHGYWLENELAPMSPAVSPALLAAQQRRQHQPLQPTAASEADTYIIDRVVSYIAV